MKIRVQFFSQLKEIVGASEKTLELAEGTTIEDLLAELFRLHPGLVKLDRQILIGVGG